jgi:uncharacterized damage-inducible protein DinB
MFEHCVTLNEFNRGYLQLLMADISDEQLDHQPADGLHSIRWILAHLAVVSDYGFKLLGQPLRCPLAWHAAYGPTSAAGTARVVRPSRDDLLLAIEKGYAALCEALKSVAPGILDGPHEVELLKNSNLKSKADLTAHILATHFATHLGQLSTLRRLMGRAPLF